MSRLPVLLLGACLVLVTQPNGALAYVGPGAGITMLSALWGVLVAILLAMAFVLFWPIRVLLRRRRQQKRKQVGAEATRAVANHRQHETSS
jgi:membrane protein implicated in regulation of membrane protease activity